MARIEVVGVFRIESLYFFAGPAAAGRRDPEESRPCIFPNQDLRYRLRLLQLA